MSSAVPPCRTITVVGFPGCRVRGFVASFRHALDDEKAGRGSGPTKDDCLLFAGHAGVSTDGSARIYAFNPNGAGVPVWQLLDRLKNADALPGIVRDDTAVFAAAQNRGMSLLSFKVKLPDLEFQSFASRLDAERHSSQHSYGYPNGDGDCNCITWLERLGLSLLTGRMNELVNMPGISNSPTRRFGRCV